MSLVRSVPFSSDSTTGDSPGRVLVAEDDTMFRRILQKWLENWGYQVIIAEDGGKAWSILQQERPPELLVLDWMMPEIEGVELCRRIRQQQRRPYQYILLVTGKDDKEDLIKGLEAGADDYLIKPFEQNELRAHLLVAKRILKLQQDLINAREELRSQAMHDGLTGIWNRGAVLDQLSRELDRSTRAHTTTGVLMLDLDHFKKVNDTYGHLTGDIVLREVAKRITESVRFYDTVGRYGGEEFVVVLPNCGKAEIEQLAERIRFAIASVLIPTVDMEIAVTVSIGASVAAAELRWTNDILAAADKALYQAKEAGRNRVCFKELECKAMLPMDL